MATGTSRRSGRREAVARARPPEPAALPGPPRVDRPLDAESLLALQRGAGNAGVAQLMARQPAPGTTDAKAAADAPYLSWTKDEVRPIQRELRRLRLYDLSIDGILGKVSDQGLVEAFGGDEWRELDSGTVLERLKGATRPKPGRGKGGGDFRYGELFKDGLLDLTFGYGYMEELQTKENWDAYAKEMEDALVGRGYAEDATKAASLYAAAGRKTSGYGRFFVKHNALTYTPPAGPARPINAIVRFIMNPGGDKGAETLQAFEEGMTQGDVAYYSGHGRYGTGPDFDPNFGRIELLDEKGNVELEPENYKVLRQVLSDESGGKPWTRFLWRHKNNRIRIDLSNAGNLRINAKSPHMDEFGGKLIQWALDQGAVDTATGKDGKLAEDAAANPDRKYRVAVFDGCNTRDYERAIRKTPGFDTRSADIIGTKRTVGFGAEVEAFVAFLDGLVGQHSPAEVIKGMNEEMKEHEGGYSGAPFEGSGFADNPSR
jgi:hypothetical protein